MSQIKNGGLDQYDAVPFEQQQFRTAGVEEVNFIGIESNRIEYKPVSPLAHL